MRRFLLLLIGLLCAVPMRAANPAFVRLLTASTAALQTSSSLKTLAITPANTSTAGDDIIVGVTRKTTSITVTSVVSSVTSAVFLPYTGELPNSTNDIGGIWVCHKCASITTAGTITVNTSANGVFAVSIVEYSGVTSYGQAAAKIGTSTGPNESITTQDANNMVVMVTASIGSDGIPTAGTGCGTTSGNLRVAGRTANASTGIAIGFCDQAATSAGTSVSLTDTITSSAWVATALELRSGSAPMTDHVESYGGHNFDSQDATTGQDFLYPISGDPALSGNTGICVGFWPTGIATPTVSDDKTDTVTKDKEIDGASVDQAVWRVATTTGARMVKFHFSSALAAGSIHSASCSNFSAALTVDSGTTPTCGAASATGPNYSCGAMSTAAADIIFVAVARDGGFGYTNTTMGPCREGNGYTLLIPENVAGYCTEYTVTAGSGSPNPAIYFSDFASGAGGDTNNTNNIIGVAYHIGAAGTAPGGLYISHEWQPAFNSSVSQAAGYINCPSSGNFMTATSTAGARYTIKDSNQVAWTTNQASAASGQLYYSTNSSLDSSSMCSYSNTDGGNDEAFTRDIAGVATSNPIAVPGACPSPSTLINSGNNVACDNDAMTGTTPTQSDGPDFTPAASGDLIIDSSAFGTGPTLAAAGPTGALYDCVAFTGQGDGNGFCYGEGHMHYYTTGTSALNFSWTMGSGSGTPTNGSAGAWEIKAAPGGGGGTTIIPSLPLLGAGVGERDSEPPTQ